MNRIITSICFFLFSFSSLFAQKTYLHCGYLWNNEQASFETEKTVVIVDNTITKVADGYLALEKGSRLIDLKTAYVMPGFMDMHVHIEHESSKNRYLERFTMNEADIAFRSTVYARRTLMAGFTTVRDLGGTGVNIALRKAINEGVVDGPRVYTCGKSIASTGGHADPTNGMRNNLKGDPGAKEGVINSPEEGRKAVRQRYKDGADVIKVTATGGVLSVAKDGQGPQFFMDELEAIVQTARDYGMTTAAHAHGAEGMKRAVVAGITSIEHGTFMTDEIMDLMKERGTYYVPTISAGRFVAEKAKQPGYYPTIIIPKALKVGPQIQHTFELAHKAGVKIAFGTDAGVSPHGENGKEFKFMVEAGMTPENAILTATKHAAELLNVSENLGEISAGKWADIVAVYENPLENIDVLSQVDFVMKDGVIYKEKK